MIFRSVDFSTSLGVSGFFLWRSVQLCVKPRSLWELMIHCVAHFIGGMYIWLGHRFSSGFCSTRNWNGILFCKRDVFYCSSSNWLSWGVLYFFTFYDCVLLCKIWELSYLVFFFFFFLFKLFLFLLKFGGFTLRWRFVAAGNREFWCGSNIFKAVLIFKKVPSAQFANVKSIRAKSSCQNALALKC